MTRWLIIFQYLTTNSNNFAKSGHTVEVLLVDSYYRPLTIGPWSFFLQIVHSKVFTLWLLLLLMLVVVVPSSLDELLLALISSSSASLIANLCISQSLGVTVPVKTSDSLSRKFHLVTITLVMKHYGCDLRFRMLY